MPLESAIVDRVKKALRAIDPKAKIVKTNGDGEPDLFCSVHGLAVLVECKQPGKNPPPLQRYRLAEWDQSGAFALWTDDGETFHLTHMRGITSVDGHVIGLDELRARIERRVALRHPY